jgi:phosphoribosylamine--glycine ligase
MQVLIIGSGGREHALTWKIRQSPQVDKVFCIPGNGGMARDAECLPGDLGNPEELAQLAEQLKADLTVVGPEAPLVAGVVDEFEKRDLKIIGPRRDAARLEASKVFAKQFMERHRIPTARFVVPENLEAAARSLAEFDFPVVVKADGLAAGKGVRVVETPEEAVRTLDEYMRKRVLGAAGDQVVLEEFLPGEEISFMVLVDGENFLTLAPSEDHKRAYDSDQGPNTGGMGAYSEDQMIDSGLRGRILDLIVEPTLAGLGEEGIDFRGILYCGLKLTPEGPKVLEYNVRWGDPEAQPVLMRLHTDLMELFLGVVEKRLHSIAPRWSPDPALCVVMASQGYPVRPEVGKAIDGIEEAEKVGGVKVFHAGTKLDNGGIISTGGRVLGVTAAGEDLQTAREKAYQAVSRIRFEGCHFRRDIGAKRLLRAAGSSRTES